MGQTGSHVEHESDPFIKRINRVNPNMTWTHLASTHDLFINRLVMLDLLVALDLLVVSDFATPTINI